MTESARAALSPRRIEVGKETQMSILWIILIVIIVLALLGFVGGRGRW